MFAYSMFAYSILQVVLLFVIVDVMLGSSNLTYTP